MAISEIIRVNVTATALGPGSLDRACPPTKVRPSHCDAAGEGPMKSLLPKEESFRLHQGHRRIPKRVLILSSKRKKLLPKIPRHVAEALRNALSIAIVVDEGSVFPPLIEGLGGDDLVPFALLVPLDVDIFPPLAGDLGDELLPFVLPFPIPADADDLFPPLVEHLGDDLVLFESG